jgi:hypothetical protein
MEKNSQRKTVPKSSVSEQKVRMAQPKTRLLFRKSNAIESVNKLTNIDVIDINKYKSNDDACKIGLYSS